ncbi:MAG: EF-P 5-aminopentanol modification-associated protein YfmF [Acutalibacteraceae bacterium]
MKYELVKKDLAEGLHLCEISAENFKTACASITFTLPLGDKASLYALVPNVLTRSSKKYPDLTSIEERLALLYGAEITVDVSKSGEHQNLKITIGFIDDRFAIDGENLTEECCKLLFELVFNPKLNNGVFCDLEVESEKRLLAERLSAESSDKRIYAKNRCDEIMFSNEVYGINRYGTLDDINAVTPETLYMAYREVLETSEITVCISGGESEGVENMLKCYTEKLSRKVIKSKTLFVERAENVQYVKEQEAVKQGKLVMGFRLGMANEEDNYAPRRVMVDLFGGSPSSKLFTVVREKMSLCYYCSARMFRQKGVMFVQSGIESYNEEKAKNAILQQLEDIKNGNFTDEDLDSSKKALEDSFKSVTDSPETLDNWYMSQVVSQKFLPPEDFVEGFKNVTREQIIEVAKEVTLDTVFMLEGTLEGGAENE